MRHRVTSLVACLAVVCWSVFAVAGDLSSLADFFHEQPVGSLIRQLEGDFGLSVVPGPADGDVAKTRWQVEQNEPAELVLSDVSSKLVVRQRRLWLQDQDALLIETTLRNDSKSPVTLRRFNVADWTFRVLKGQDAARYRPLEYRNDTWYGSTYWTGPDWTRVGKDWHHSGTNTPGVRQFEAPREGRVRITGRVFKADTNNGGGDGVRLFIRHGRKTVWQAEIDGDDDRGVEPDISLNVRQGDAVRFVVHKRGTITCDTTHWDPLVSYADGERFQASTGFSAKSKSGGPWSYEMEVDPQAETGLPHVYGFGRNLAHAHAVPGEERPVVLSSEDTLPLAVIAGSADRNGIAVAWTDEAGWQFESRMTEDGRMRVQLSTNDGDRLTLKAGESLQLPRVALAAYRGPWTAGMQSIDRLLSRPDPNESLDTLRRQLSRKLTRAPGLPTNDADGDATSSVGEFAFWAMIQNDWRRRDGINETAESYALATRQQIGKTRRLLTDLRAHAADSFLADETEQFEQLAQRADRNDLSVGDRQSLYLQVRWLKRQIALANPLLQFDRLLFCKRVPTSYSHEVMQYYGWRARPGGGIFVLTDPGYSLATRDILDGRASGGNVLEPRLSYDGRRIVFSYVDCTADGYDPQELQNDVDRGFYHIWEVNVDGTGLRQLTSGPYDDVMPTYLPDGGIGLCSTRRRGHSRCFGGQFSRRWQVYTVHRMNGDGGNIRTLSYHDTNEWFPAVSNTGLLLYSRWDYIDRDAVTHQNLWSSRVDGTNPVAVWGNATDSPHCTFQIQPIPGSHKIVFTGSAHHSVTAGSIAVVDPRRGDDGEQALTRITPDVPFPEAEGRDIREYYAAPWPLSEKYFLAAYSPRPLVFEPGANEPNALGIYLIDAFGNRELIYRDPHIGSTNPCPLLPRPTPPVVSSDLPRDPPPTGEMIVQDVYRGLGDLPRGTIKQLRIVQIFPKTTPLANKPPIGLAGEENARAILGTVPVEADGSARFTVPARKLILFQALDENGFAYQTMRSVTYVQPGERVSCVGCHERRSTTPAPTDLLALQRRPSRIEPGQLGGRPFSFVEVVQPLLDGHCVECHGGDQPDGGIDLTDTLHDGFTRSYWSLCNDRNFTGGGTNPKNAAEALVPRFGARNQIQTTPPGGKYGALGSRLINLLRSGHYDVKLTRQDFRRLAAWIDLNAVFFGVYDPEGQACQQRGEIVAMPEIQ